MHKATHHFDLLNWYLASEPEEVFARGDLRYYGRNGPFRGQRCRDLRPASECDFHIDIGARSLARHALRGPSRVDGYLRDACVFREEIDISTR